MGDTGAHIERRERGGGCDPCVQHRGARLDRLGRGRDAEDGAQAGGHSRGLCRAAQRVERGRGGAGSAPRENGRCQRERAAAAAGGRAFVGDEGAGTEGEAGSAGDQVDAPGRANLRHRAARLSRAVERVRGASATRWVVGDTVGRGEDAEHPTGGAAAPAGPGHRLTRTLRAWAWDACSVAPANRVPRRAPPRMGGRGARACRARADHGRALVPHAAHGGETGRVAVRRGQRGHHAARAVARDVVARARHGAEAANTATCRELGGWHSACGHCERRGRVRGVPGGCADAARARARLPRLARWRVRAAGARDERQFHSAHAVRGGGRCL